MSVVSSASFATAFYDKDDQGVEILMNKLRQAKQTVVQVQNMFAQRASIEEEYGKKLLKLSKASLGREETGTVQSSLGSIRNEMEFVGRSHLELAALIRSELEQTTIAFLATQKEQRKSHTAVIERSMRTKALHTASMHKAKERYEAEYMRANGMAPQRSSGMMSKLNMIGQGNSSGRNPELEYQEACEKLQSVTQRFDNDWRQACDKFQIMEEERIEFLRNIFWNYANIFAGVCVTDDESFERVRQSLEQCDIDHDIATFVELKGINAIPPVSAPPTAMGYNYPNTTPSHPHNSMSAPGGDYNHGQINRPEEQVYNNAHPPQGQTYPPPPPQQQQQRPISQNTPAGIAATPAGYPHQAPNPAIPATNTTVQQTSPESGKQPEVYANAPSNPSMAPAPPPPAAAATAAAATLTATIPSGASTMQPPMGGQTSGAPSATGGTEKEGFLVRAIYDYDATMEEEMSFKEGEIIRVITTQLDGWWEGEIESNNGIRRGQFPSNFIEPLIF
ncbi:hypothetical protein BDF19DRAFT_452704 [Syncephalis fuscata]|nr:hypothetical protein BDF19DRAFT_452704 [Syncephalis fuscata]